MAPAERVVRGVHSAPLVLSRVHWVRPELVAEVKYLTWTEATAARGCLWKVCARTSRRRKSAAWPLFGTTSSPTCAEVVEMDPETSPVSMPCDVVMNAILDALAPLGVTDCQCRARRARLARDPRARM